MTKDPQDGFDLIEYPCEFAFKAMCRVNAALDESPTQHVSGIVASHLSEAAILGSRSNLESVTISVHLENREQLEGVYQAIANSDRVVMTL